MGSHPNRASLAACRIGAEGLVDPVRPSIRHLTNIRMEISGLDLTDASSGGALRGGETENAATQCISVPLAGSSREVGDPVPARARGYA